MELKEFSNLSLNYNEDILAMPNHSPLMGSLQSTDEIFQYAKTLNFGEMHFKMDPMTGLFAIIAIHSTKLGPAIGGCRCIHYDSTNAAIVDAIRLAYGMSYKAAICDLPHGGA